MKSATESPPRSTQAWSLCVAVEKSTIVIFYSLVVSYRLRIYPANENAAVVEDNINIYAQKLNKILSQNGQKLVFKKDIRSGDANETKHLTKFLLKELLFYSAECDRDWAFIENL